PLASVFGVSTDVLFGTSGTNDDDAVWEIINEAQSHRQEPVTAENLKLIYNKLQEGLEKYPCNPILLMHCLEYGISLAYPRNDCYDKENAREIYKECARMANVVISYGKDINHSMRAHMIMAFLHSAYGNFELAREHSEQFPFRSDMTRFCIDAFINDDENDILSANRNRSYDIAYHLYSVYNDMMLLSTGYEKMEQYAEAESVLLYMLEIVDAICKDESVHPSMHQGEYGDAYGILANLCVKQGKIDEAFEWLGRMTEFDLTECKKYKAGMNMQNSVLRDAINMNYFPIVDRKKRLVSKLNAPCFDDIRNDERFVKLVEKVN
ncbi:MAG: hypothetical protein IJ386_07350, partial [Clostridia bacterium]|nr:hypothetical protein [Clostridia bacterium]